MYGLESDVVPTGVDTSYFFPLNSRAPNSRPVVLFVGSLRPFKGPHVVLDAATQFPEADFRIVGEGVIGEELRTRARREGIRNISFLGALSTSQTKQQYQSADIFLFPSRWEGSPKVLLEAAACGRPLIVSDVPGCRHFVRHGREGLVVPPGDVAAMAAALSRLAGDVDLRRDLGLAARERVLAGFTMEIVRREVRKAYQDALRV